MVLPLVGDGIAWAVERGGNAQLAETIRHYDHIPINVSLMVVVSALVLSVILSLVFPREHKEKIGDYETDIPPDYDFSDYERDENAGK